MRILAVGDVHGCSLALRQVLEETCPAPGDTLVFLGDYVDRGPDSRGVLEQLLDLSSRPNTFFLKGNHELFLLRSLKDMSWAQDWLHVGGMETLTSYNAAATWDLPEEHLEFLENTCQDYLEREDFIFVHAGLDPFLSMAAQPEEALFWRRFSPMTHHESGKTVVCGHTAQKTGLPLQVEQAVCIDTWAYGKGWLTCLDVLSGEFIQAKKTGEVRRGAL